MTENLTEVKERLQEIESLSLNELHALRNEGDEVDQAAAKLETNNRYGASLWR